MGVCRYRSCVLGYPKAKIRPTKTAMCIILHTREGNLAIPAISLPVAGFQCTDWQLKTVPGGRITLYSVAEFGVFSTFSSLTDSPIIVIREVYTGVLTRQLSRRPNARIFAPRNPRHVAHRPRCHPLLDAKLLRLVPAFRWQIHQRMEAQRA